MGFVVLCFVSSYNLIITQWQQGRMLTSCPHIRAGPARGRGGVLHLGQPCARPLLASRHRLVPWGRCVLVRGRQGAGTGTARGGADTVWGGTDTARGGVLRQHHHPVPDPGQHVPGLRVCDQGHPQPPGVRREGTAMARSKSTTVVVTLYGQARVNKIRVHDAP